ncbi:MAG: hypothetical protein EXS16_21845 [Gemmataceae bacterium]|nr:hypothetical protein [Gemmataceae bacterium]
MKKILVLGAIAIGMLATSKQEAPAWIKTGFRAGINWDYQSGGNSALWGLWRDGQPASPEVFGGHHHSGPHFGVPSQFMMPQTSAPGAYQMAPQGFVPQGPNLQGQPVMPSALVPHGVNVPVSYQGSPYQFANHPRPMYYYYTPYYAK